MNKQELVEKMVGAAKLEGLEIPKSRMGNLMDAMGNMFIQELAAGGEATLPGLGNVVTEKRAARTGRNPRTGAEIQISAKLVAKLRPGKALKAALNPQAGE